MTKERVGALFFLLFSIAYGLLAFRIPLIFLAQEEVFNARTMPFALSIAGAVISFLILVLPPVKGQPRETLGDVTRGLDWTRVVLLLLLTVGYGLIMQWIGFVIASILFLAVGFRIMGETRIYVMFGVAVPLVLFLWYLLSKLLGMYIAPGAIFYFLKILES